MVCGGLRVGLESALSIDLFVWIRSGNFGCDARGGGGGRIDHGCAANREC